MTEDDFVVWCRGESHLEDRRKVAPVARKTRSYPKEKRSGKYTHDFKDIQYSFFRWSTGKIASVEIGSPTKIFALFLTSLQALESSPSEEAMCNVRVLVQRLVSVIRAISPFFTILPRLYDSFLITIWTGEGTITEKHGFAGNQHSTYPTTSSQSTTNNGGHGVLLEENWWAN